MKKVLLPLCSGIAILFLANWGTPESSTDGQQKNSIDFYGKLETWQGQSYKVENISFDHQRFMTVYDKPVYQAGGPETAAPAPQYQLTQNPITDFVKTKIDLHEVASVEIPNPNQRWSHKKNKGNHEIEFLEIIIISKDAQKTKTSYLIEARKKLYCDRSIAQDQREVPLTAIKKLTIEGFKYCEPGTKKCRPVEETHAPTPSTLPVA